MSNFPEYFNEVSFNFEVKQMDFEGVKNLEFLQIGVYTGDASLYLLEKYSQRSNFILTDVDTWLAGDSKEMQELDFYSIEQFYLERTSSARESGRLVSIKTTSDQFFATNNQKYNFIYIDGSHESSQLLKDLLNAFAALHVNGILAIDDYLGATNKPIKDRPFFAINLYLDLMEGKFEVLLNNYQIWLRKDIDS
jgi:hypothetical protein